MSNDPNLLNSDQYREAKTKLAVIAEAQRHVAEEQSSLDERQAALDERKSLLAADERALTRAIRLHAQSLGRIYRRDPRRVDGGLEAGRPRGGLACGGLPLHSYGERWVGTRPITVGWTAG